MTKPPVVLCSLFDTNEQKPRSWPPILKIPLAGPVLCLTSTSGRSSNYRQGYPRLGSNTPLRKKPVNVDPVDLLELVILIFYFIRILYFSY